MAAMRRIALLPLLFATYVVAGPTPPLAPDVPASFTPPGHQADYERREVMIPMRDGVKLFTVIFIPKGAKHAPILLTRTPYNAAKRGERSASTHLADVLPQMDDQIAADGGYIRVFQDVRGKYGSEGDYVMTRPLRGPLNDSAVDHSTDAYDTIDWLVKNVKESNGKVGMIGSSYEGFTVLMALVRPHPALVVAVPECPMVDGWLGDDWFHAGAFRQVNFDYFTGQTMARGEGKAVPRTGHDDYAGFLRAGSAGDFARAAGLDQLPWWKKMTEHPAYDAFWQGQALDRALAAQPLTVPTMIVASLWDQEDSYGWSAVYAALAPKDKTGLLHLVLGPWRHSGANYDAPSLGILRFDADTALQFRRDVLKPFLDQHLKDRAPKASTPPVVAYETGTNAWRKLARWPIGKPRALYLEPAGRAEWAAPKVGGFDEYVSDPAKPVPYLPRPVRFEDRDAWKTWLVSDQRAVVDRPDVLAWQTEALTQPVQIAAAAPGSSRSRASSSRRLPEATSGFG